MPEKNKMHHAIETFYKETQRSLEAVNTWAIGLESLFIADHIGLKCKDSRFFEAHRSVFERESAFIYQSMISGRRIALIKLPEPLPTRLGNIWYLELSDQKPGERQSSHIDHIEIYPMPRSAYIEDMILIAKRNRGIDFKKVVRPHHTTYDITLINGFKIRLEAEPLIDKIKREEMK